MNKYQTSSVLDAVDNRSKIQEVVIVGAGPYGLSSAAHLLNAGITPYVIGQPMQFWKQNMPGHMLLRSRIEASNIAAPQRHLSLAAYQKAIRRRLPEPLPVEDFIAYADWFQKQVAPNLDTRNVQEISYNGDVFDLALDDGETLRSRSVVLALGIGPFLYRPEEFAGIPPDLAPHSSELSDLSGFSEKRVMVIGKGQSALEYAALLHESGAEVQIVTRSSAVTFRPFAWRKHLFRTLTPWPLRGFSYRILPPTDLGDIKTARKMADPDLFRKQPHEMQSSLIKDCTKPVGAYWLAPRLTDVRKRTGVSVRHAEVSKSGVRIELSDGNIEQVDMVVLATGYKIDISKYKVLNSSLQNRIEKTDGYPVLKTNLETSVDGLFMVGVIAERTLGPTLRFVTGTSNAGPRLAAGIVEKRSNW